jgi:hypothetical protein
VIVNIEHLIAAMSEAGYFPQLLEIDTWSDDPVVETSRTFTTAPLIRTFRDRTGRWVLTVFGDTYCHVPNESDVPIATLEMLRAMDRSMKFSQDVIKKYNLIELDPDEFESADA